MNASAVRYADTRVCDREAVVFDGYLPEGKVVVRRERANAALVRTLNRAAAGGRSHATTLRSLGSNTPPLATAVLQDVLRVLEVEVRVSTLEEGDRACVRYALEAHARSGRDVYIISLDADMHIYRLPAGIWYLSIDGITVTHEKCITGMAYDYEESSRRCGVDVLTLATVMGVEGSGRVSRPADEAIRLLRKSPLLDLVGAEEVSRAEILFELPQGPPQDSDKWHAALYGRFAELYCGQDIWLPYIVVDNVSEPSPWLVSGQLRRAAYACLKRKCSNPPIEWCRRADLVTGRAVKCSQDDAESFGDLNADNLFIVCMRLLQDHLDKDSRKAMSQAEVLAFVIMIESQDQASSNSSDLVLTRRSMSLLSQYQTILWSAIVLLQARGQPHPQIHEVFDAPIFIETLSQLTTNLAVNKRLEACPQVRPLFAKVMRC
ncbi:hypothetical protein PYCC9005_000392 [Savitreella phatthalungensis]